MFDFNNCSNDCQYCVFNTSCEKVVNNYKKWIEDESKSILRKSKGIAPLLYNNKYYFPEVSIKNNIWKFTLKINSFAKIEITTDSKEKLIEIWNNFLKKDNQ